MYSDLVYAYVAATADVHPKHVASIKTEGKK
jgi:hypothetical protein